jgi:hypothetical protein
LLDDTRLERGTTKPGGVSATPLPSNHPATGTPEHTSIDFSGCPAHKKPKNESFRSAYRRAIRL